MASSSGKFLRWLTNYVGNLQPPQLREALAFNTRSNVTVTHKAFDVNTASSSNSPISISDGPIAVNDGIGSHTTNCSYPVFAEVPCKATSDKDTLTEADALVTHTVSNYGHQQKNFSNTSDSSRPFTTLTDTSKETVSTRRTPEAEEVETMTNLTAISSQTQHVLSLAVGILSKVKDIDPTLYRRILPSAIDRMIFSPSDSVQSSTSGSGAPQENLQTLHEALLEQHKTISDYHGLSTDVLDLVSQELDAANLELSPLASKSAQPSSKTKKTGLNKAAAMTVEEIRTLARKENRDRVDLDIRTRSLVENFTAEGITSTSRLFRLEELTNHLRQSPQSRSVAIKAKVIPSLMSLRRQAVSKDRALLGQVNETLSLLGQVDPLPRRGLRILSIDGGGTRGFISIETMRSLEAACGGRRIRDMFDYVCGVSTGALLAVLVASLALPLNECERIYKECSKEMFTRNRLLGTSKLFTSHAYYDSSILENILKDKLGTFSLLSTSKMMDCPKIGLVSSVIKENRLVNYIFRNYGLPPGIVSQYTGSFDAKTWESIRASSAAPGYFEEFKYGGQVHQDGGLLNNNPTAIAIHEAKLLWPDEPIQCVVSLGNGRPISPIDYEADKDGGFSSLRTKFNVLVNSATGTESIHTVLHDLLDPAAYFRFNPCTSEDYTLDEIRPEKIEAMQFEAHMYLRKNSKKVEQATQRLMEQRPLVKQCQDWVAQTVEKVMP